MPKIVLLYSISSLCASVERRIIIIMAEVMQMLVS